MNTTPYYDLTTFTNEVMNGWITGPVGSTGSIGNEDSDGERNYYFKGPGGTGNAHGELLSKQFTGLKKNARYAFHLRAKEYQVVDGRQLNIAVRVANAEVLRVVGIPGHWQTLATTFVAPAETLLVSINGFASVPVYATESYALDDLSLREVLQDITDFTGEQLNGWEFGEAGQGSRFVAEAGNTVLTFPTGSGNHAGVVLRKQHVDQLVVGDSYSFRVQARRDDGRYRTPKLLLSADDVSTEVTELTVAGEWVTLELNFTATSSSTELQLLNREASGSGNDYSIDNLILEAAAEPTASR